MISDLSLAPPHPRPECRIVVVDRQSVTSSTIQVGVSPFRGKLVDLAR
jgi:hypothetical protein